MEAAEQTRPMSWVAKKVLNAVEAWATDSFLLRETCVIENGRLDGLLVPMSWTSPVRAGLFGIEVKISRSDFLRGLKSGQFERYASQLHGLFLATPKGVCKTSELPRGVGHLVVSDMRDEVAVCRRKASRSPFVMSEPMLWKILYDAFDQQRKQLREERELIATTVRRIRRHVGSRVVHCAELIEKSLRTRACPVPTLIDAGDDE